MKALQSVGQVIGEILKQLDDERCKLAFPRQIGPKADVSSHCKGVEWTAICRFVQANIASLKGKLPRPSCRMRGMVKLTNQLKSGVRVSLDMTTLTIMRILPREVDPMVCLLACLWVVQGVSNEAGVQHVSRRPRSGIVRRYRWSR